MIWLLGGVGVGGGGAGVGGNIVGNDLIGGRERDCLVRSVMPVNLG